MKRFLQSVSAVLAAMSAAAKVQLTPQNCSAPVWGKAEPGAKVTVTPSWNRKDYVCPADAGGKWQVRIQTPKGGFKEYTLTISDGDPLVTGKFACPHPSKACRGLPDMNRTWPRYYTMRCSGRWPRSRSRESSGTRVSQMSIAHIAIATMRIFRKVPNTHRGMVTNQLDYFSVHL